MAVFPVDKVLPLLMEGKPSFEYTGIRVSLTSTRIRTYTKGITCLCCKRSAEFFALERSGGRDITKGWHFNLYFIHPVNGTEVMMTSDHIVAKSKGGDDKSLDNRQPLCARCNNLKASRSMDEVGPNFENLKKLVEADQEKREATRERRRLESAMSHSERYWVSLIRDRIAMRGQGIGSINPLNFGVANYFYFKGA